MSKGRGAPHASTTGHLSILRYIRLSITHTLGQARLGSQSETCSAWDSTPRLHFSNRIKPEGSVSADRASKTWIQPFKHRLEKQHGSQTRASEALWTRSTAAAVRAAETTIAAGSKVLVQTLKANL